MRSLHLPLLVALVLAASPALAQDLQVRCEVYRFSEAARGKLFAKGPQVTAAGARAAGQLRYQATLPLDPKKRAYLSRSRRIAYRTQTTNNVATANSIQFMTLADRFICEVSPARAKGQPDSLSLHLELADVVEGKTYAGLPVVDLRQLVTQVTLDLGREWVIVQGSKTGGVEALQVIVIKVTAQPAPKRPLVRPRSHK